MATQRAGGATGVQLGPIQAPSIRAHISLIPISILFLGSSVSRAFKLIALEGECALEQGTVSYLKGPESGTFGKLPCYMVGGEWGLASTF